MSLKSVVITGANRGLGLEFVRQLLASDSPPKHLIVTARQPSNEELDKLKAKNQSLHVLQLDTKNYNRFDEFAENVKQIVGDFGVDTLINNAGILINSGLHNVTVLDMIENFEINTVAPLMLTKALLPLLKTASSKRKTAVINITSLLGSIELNTNIEGRPTSTSKDRAYPYRASKAALNMVSKCLSNDLKADGIYVMALHPGWVQTDLGGGKAPLTPSASISHMLKTIKNINEKSGENLISFDGSVLPY